MGDTPLSRIEEWFRYARDLNLGPFYLQRAPISAPSAPIAAPLATPPPPPATATAPVASAPLSPRRAAPASQSASVPMAAEPIPVAVPRITKPSIPTPTPAKKPPLPPMNIAVAPGFNLFEPSDPYANESLEKIREDIGECVRCKLHKGRTNIVFGAGDPKANLIFIGEGPGRDEDKQGLPFVGRSGKLLTSMIEAMGLKREQVYICNVVKCRPPENRTPEKDEIATCSPFLHRQIRAIAPKAIVCLGAVAAQALLATGQSVSRYRGEWLEFMGSRLMITYHPAYLLRNPSAKGEVWKDLQKVMLELGLPKKMATPR